MLHDLFDSWEALLAHQTFVLPANDTIQWRIAFFRFRIRIAETQFLPVRFDYHVQSADVPSANLLHQIVDVIFDDEPFLEEIRLRSDVQITEALRIHVDAQVVPEQRYLIESGITDATDGLHFVIYLVDVFLGLFVWTE